MAAMAAMAAEADTKLVTQATSLKSPRETLMIRGRCLCEVIEFEIAGETTKLGMCHCSKCRRVSGVASNAVFMVPRACLRWVSGEDEITKFSLPSGWGVWRCSTCGSPTPMMHPGGGAYFIPAGLLDADPTMKVAAHIFVGSKAPWDEIAGNAPQHVEGFESERVG